VPISLFITADSFFNKTPNPREFIIAERIDSIASRNKIF